jgi:hypothetical protein
MAKASGFGSAVSKFKKNWDTAKKQKPDSFEDAKLPEGKYFIRVASARCGLTKADKTPYVSFNFRVIRGPHTGARLSKYSGLEKDTDIEYLSKDFQRMGYEVSDLELGEIEDLVADIAKSKPYLDAQIKHDTYVNKKGVEVESQRLYVNSAVDPSELPPGDDGDDSDAPKAKGGGKPKGGAAAKAPKKKAARK